MLTKRHVGSGNKIVSFPAIFFKIGSWKNSAIIKVKIMATNAEVDCNEKDYSNGKSEGNILIFICVKLYFVPGLQIEPARHFHVSVRKLCEF